jgi:hypothetical protein
VEGRVSPTWPAIHVARRVFVGRVFFFVESWRHLSRTVRWSCLASSAGVARECSHPHTNRMAGSSMGDDRLPARVSPSRQVPLAKWFGPPSFDLAPIPGAASGGGSCYACSLTMRAADKWDSARFIGIFLASGLYCSQALSTLRPLAANANR